MGLVFCVSSVNHTLSAARTVRPSGCWYTSPTSKSSYTRPVQPCFSAMFSSATKTSSAEIFSVKPASSVRPGKTEHVLGNVGENQVGRNRRNLIQPRLAKLAFNVIFLSEAKTAVGLHSGVRALPGSVGGQQLGHVGLRAAGLMRVKQRGGARHHQRRSLYIRVGAGQRELHALILPNRTPKDDPL